MSYIRLIIWWVIVIVCTLSLAVCILSFFAVGAHAEDDTSVLTVTFTIKNGGSFTENYDILPLGEESSFFHCLDVATLVRKSLQKDYDTQYRSGVVNVVAVCHTGA